jgi:hypothetical protein
VAAPGISMNVDNKNYYMWETTSSGFDIGSIPSNLQNLDYWKITLLNKNL